MAKSLLVKRAVSLLDSDTLTYVTRFGAEPLFKGPVPKTTGEILGAVSNKAAIAKLQDLGMLTFMTAGKHDLFIWTEFGKAVIKATKPHSSKA